MIDSEKKWFILYTRSGQEKRVSNLLTRKKIENYFPINRQITSRKKVLMEPLFSSYVFVKIEECYLVNLRTIEGVINFAYWLGKPAIIRNEEINILKRFLNEYSTINLEKVPFDIKGSFITSDPSIIEEYDYEISVKNNSIKLVLPSVGYIITAELEKSQVEIYNSKKQPLEISEKFQFAI